MIKNKHLLILFFITLIGFLFRFYALADVPNSLARDEVSAVYNAYALIKNGTDEHGNFFPIAFKAFGDWKLPVEIYLEIPGILLFGLNEFSTRLPEALLGSLSIPLLYFVIVALAGNKYRHLALLASLFFALSPWHMYMSRNAFGYNVLGLFFFLSAMYFFLEFLKGRKWHLLWANISFILTLFSYTAFHIFTPLMIVGLVLLYRKNFRLNKFFILHGVLFIAFYAVASFSVLEANVQKIAGTSLWHDPNFYMSQVYKPREEHGFTFLSKLIHNKPFAFVQQLGVNYVSTFSPEFMVTKGGANKINNVEGMGNMYLVEYVLFFIGIAFMFIKKLPHKKVIFLWLLMGAVPAIITREAPHSTRNLMLTPMLAVGGAYGLLCLFEYVRKQKSYVKIGGYAGIAGIVVMGIVQVFLYSDNYFVHLSRDRGEYWNAGYKEVVEHVRKKNPSKLVMGDMSRSPYVYFLFYNQYDPATYIREVQKAPPTWDNFEHIASFNKYHFVEDIQFYDDVDEEQVMYVERLVKFPEHYPYDGIISDSTGAHTFGWFETDSDFCDKQFPDGRLPEICKQKAEGK